jgi:branched-chain amino acid transport system substrate-binding protein
MMKFHGGRVLAALMCLTAFAQSGCGPAVPDVVKIGVAATLTGPTANRGQDLLNGAVMAVDELNASGFKVGGKPIRFEIVARDDQADVNAARAVARDLVDQRVHVVLGHTNSPQMKAAMPTYVAHRTLMLSTTTQRTLIDAGGGYMFRLVPNDRVQARALSTFYAERLGGRRAVAVVEATDYGREMFSDFAESLKERSLPVPEKIEVDFKQPVDGDKARRIKALQAEVVVLIAREQHGLSLMEQLKAVQHVGVAVLATNAVRTDKMVKSEIPVQAFYTTSTTITLAELPAGEAFRRRFVDKFKSEPVWGAHYTYDAVHAVADTIRRAGTVEPNTRIFQQMRFSATGEQARPTIGIYKAEHGAWVPQARSSIW